MGHTDDYTGRITIDPPLSARETARVRRVDGVGADEVRVVVDEGVGVGFESAGAEHGYYVTEGLALMVEACAVPGRTFGGYLEGLNYMGVWRLVVRGGRVVRIAPAWPDA
ncbi:hypothetical protein [Embleya sp. NPDC005971]|uniref:hypothetical protein n=1 Tax=Embleya sp. NPDC005971 TaxID=3156724 RepID=UPI0033D96708